ncbi:MAG: MBL fold metallo-hydrolase [Sedimentisphaerales bacterium]|jgi:beta-lactamase superfamily II metal-dependent hydrolase
MGYEVDFLPVGKEDKSGDAIAIRFGNLYGTREEQVVVVIDGGFAVDGEALVNHIQTYYKTDLVDIVIATHPHNDHISGLKTVLEKMRVREFWMHKPWASTHTNNISRWFVDGRVTDKSIREALKESLNASTDLEKLANQKGIPIFEPFVGVSRDFGFGQIFIAGPTKEYYESLLPQFNCTPGTNIFAGIYEAGKVALDELLRALTNETWELETLTDSKVEPTTAENNSSVVTLLRVDGKILLFTADAGIPALTNVADFLEPCGITHESYALIQVPHHGSKRNVGPTILNRLLGPKMPVEQKATIKRAAICSCAIKSEPKHPSKKVANAFKRRGAPIIITQGSPILHPNTRGWYTAVPLEFYESVEADE